MAQEQGKERAQPVAWIDMAYWPPIRWPDGLRRCDVKHLDGAALYAAPQPNAALADGWMDIATHDGRKEDVQLFCADTGEQFVGFPGELEGTFQFATSPCGNVVCRPTHWRQLPEPPNA